MSKMHEKETFQKLATLLSSLAPDKWNAILSIYLFHDDAMKLKFFFKKADDSDWAPFNTGPRGFDVMRWWQDYHGMVKEAEGNEFKAARAILDSNGNLKIKLSYEIIDPLADIDILRSTENL